MTRYYRVMLGGKSSHAKECIEGGFIGANFNIHQDLSGHLPDQWRDFNREFIPIFLARHPEKTKVGAGLACGALWTVAKGIQQGDIILSPDGAGHYHIGKMVGDYYYQPDGILPHRRAVAWSAQTIGREAMSDALRSSTGANGTVVEITRHAGEIEQLIHGIVAPPPPLITVADETIQDPVAFAMEKHLEDFLVKNWAGLELGKQYTIYQDEGERLGQQYPTDTGPIDILAISKDKKTLIVVELKRGRISDVVVGQILRYMGYVKDELAESDQQVKGVIIALEDDQKLRRAVSATTNIDFYRYELTFKLVKI